MTAPHNSQPVIASDIADLCEKAAGPDRELDCLIFEAQHLLLMPIHRETIDGEPTGQYFAQDGTQLPECAPRYTASIDAAMTLVPEGCSADTQQGKRVHQSPVYVRRAWAQIESDPGCEFLGNATAASVPLAICAAALRARSKSS